MEKTKKTRLIKIISLILVTLIIITAVFLVIYFVNKNSKIENGQIGKVIEFSNFNFVVSTIKLENLEEDFVKLEIYIKIDAKKNSTIKVSDYSLSAKDAEILSSEGLGNEEKIKEGDSLNFVLAYKLKSTQIEQYLYCYKYKIALGRIERS